MISQYIAESYARVEGREAQEKKRSIYKPPRKVKNQLFKGDIPPGEVTCVPFYAENLLDPILKEV